MIIHQACEIVRVGDFEEIEYKVKSENLGNLFHLLRSQLYSRKGQAILREYGTNAADAHTEIDQENPFHVRLPTTLDPTLRIRDFGPGLSLKELEEIYVSMGESTKTASNLLNGCMGIGCKSAFCYTDTFEIISRHENSRVHTMAYIDESRVGKMMIIEKGTLGADELQGLEVKIPIHESDWKSLKEDALKIFSAFQIPPILSEGAETLRISRYIPEKPVTIGRGRTSAVFMGNVCYPLEPKLVGIAIPRSMGIEFQIPIGTVHFAASREALDYDSHTKNNLKYLYEKYLEEVHEDSRRVFERVKTPWQAHTLVQRLLQRSTEKYPQLQRIIASLSLLRDLNRLYFREEKLSSSDGLRKGRSLVWERKNSKSPEAPFESGWKSLEVTKLRKKSTWIIIANRAKSGCRLPNANKRRVTPKIDPWAKNILDAAEKAGIDRIIVPLHSRDWKSGWGQSEELPIQFRDRGFGPVSNIIIVPITKASPDNNGKGVKDGDDPQIQEPKLFLASRIGTASLIYTHPESGKIRYLSAYELTGTGKGISFWKAVSIITEPGATPVKPKFFLTGTARERKHMRQEDADRIGTSLQRLTKNPIHLALLLEDKDFKGNRMEICQKAKIVSVANILNKNLDKRTIYSEQLLVDLLVAFKNGKPKPLARYKLGKECAKDFSWTTHESRSREAAIARKLLSEFPLLAHLKYTPTQSMYPNTEIFHYLDTTKPRKPEKPKGSTTKL